MSYRKGHYLQVIEGPDQDVADLYKEICMDNRHKEIEKLVETQIQSRFFPGWSFKLLQSVHKAPEFTSYLNATIGGSADVSDAQRELLSIFINFDADSLANGNFSGKELLLKAWPKYREVQQSPSMMEICARLTTKPYSYESLVNSRRFGTREQIDVLLRKLDQLDLLEAFSYEESLESSNYHSESLRTKSLIGSDGFYDKMRKFLFRN